MPTPKENMRAIMACYNWLVADSMGDPQSMPPFPKLSEKEMSECYTTFQNERPVGGSSPLMNLFFLRLKFHYDIFFVSNELSPSSLNEFLYCLLPLIHQEQQKAQRKLNVSVLIENFSQKVVGSSAEKKQSLRDKYLRLVDDPFAAMRGEPIHLGYMPFFLPLVKISGAITNAQLYEIFSQWGAWPNHRDFPPSSFEGPMIEWLTKLEADDKANSELPFPDAGLVGKFNTQLPFSVLLNLMSNALHSTPPMQEFVDLCCRIAVERNLVGNIPKEEESEAAATVLERLFKLKSPTLPESRVQLITAMVPFDKEHPENFGRLLSVVNTCPQEGWGAHLRKTFLQKIWGNHAALRLLENPVEARLKLIENCPPTGWGRPVRELFLMDMLPMLKGQERVQEAELKSLLMLVAQCSKPSKALMVEFASALKWLFFNSYSLAVNKPSKTKTEPLRIVVDSLTFFVRNVEFIIITLRAIFQDGDCHHLEILSSLYQTDTVQQVVESVLDSKTSSEDRRAALMRLFCFFLFPNYLPSIKTDRATLKKQAEACIKEMVQHFEQRTIVHAIAEMGQFPELLSVILQMDNADVVNKQKLINLLTSNKTDLTPMQIWFQQDVRIHEQEAAGHEPEVAAAAAASPPQVIPKNTCHLLFEIHSLAQKRGDEATQELTVQLLEALKGPDHPEAYMALAMIWSKKEKPERLVIDEWMKSLTEVYSKANFAKRHKDEGLISRCRALLSANSVETNDQSLGAFISQYTQAMQAISPLHQRMQRAVAVQQMGGINDDPADDRPEQDGGGCKPS